MHTVSQKLYDFHLQPKTRIISKSFFAEAEVKSDSRVPVSARLTHLEFDKKFHKFYIDIFLFVGKNLFNQYGSEIVIYRHRTFCK